MHDEIAAQHAHPDRTSDDARRRFALATLRPPYRDPQPLRDPRRPFPGGAPPGAIHVAFLDRPNDQWPGVSAWVPGWRQAFPMVPVIIRIADEAADALTLVRSAAPGLGVRAVIAGGQPLAPALREAMTAPADLTSDVLEWLRLAGVSDDPRALEVVGAILRHSPARRTLTDILEPGIPGSAEAPDRGRRNVERLLSRRGLPPPGEWLRLGRLLHTYLRIQRDPTTSIENHANIMGYGGYPGLIRSTRRALGIYPRSIRGTIGWEWIVDRWCRRWIRLPSLDMRR